MFSHMSALKLFCDVSVLFCSISTLRIHNSIIDNGGDIDVANVYVTSTVTVLTL